MSPRGTGAPGPDAAARARRSAGRTVLPIVGALAVLLLVALLVARPSHLHPLERWLHAAMGRQDAASDAAATPAASPGGDAEATLADAGDTSRVKTLWTCGMHPQVLLDHPGDCPICGMKLVPIQVEKSGGAASSPGEAAAPSTGERKILFYRSPMDPSVTSPVPRKDDMGMDYVPVYADEAAARQGPAVAIDPAIVQDMNVTTETIHRQDIRRQIRTVGYLDYDQEKMVSVTTKFTGYVEKAYVNYLGQPVERGQALFDVYSPELVQTEQELLSALDYVAAMKNAPADAQKRAQALLDAARQRFAYWDISSAQVKKVEDTHEVSRTLTMVAPAGGFVMKRMSALEGMAVKPGMDVIHIADLSTLWLTVEVFENQLPWVDTGSEASIRLTYFPGETFRARVKYIEPAVAEKTRSIRLTLEVPNPDRRLRAGMYATVEFDPVVIHDALAVPSQAVLRTGERNVVVVALGNGHFEPRDVVLGAEGDRKVRVISGLNDGDHVVTSAQFLIDSESNLRAAIQKLIARRSPQS